jgi:hypothetical protein
VTLHTMTVPDEPSELPRWLERRLMAPSFGRFVAELMAHFPATPGSDPTRHPFDRWLPVALTEGLELVPAEVLSQLLKHPGVLVVFQERIVTDGGAYWDDVINRSDGLSGPFERGKRSLERMLSANTSPSNNKVVRKAVPKTTPKAVPKAVRSEAVKRTGGRGYRIWAIASTGVAACLVVLVGYLAFLGSNEPAVPKSQIAWGWGKPTGLATDQSSARDYLNKLAANVEEWSLHQSGDAAGVGARIAEFRTGCTRLMHSTYGPLTPADKEWLLEQCRAWATILDGHQQALDNGMDPLAVRAKVDETVRAIAATLRDKAKQVG